MPYKKNKKQTKRKVTKNVIQKKVMTARLILINLKVDDYVYKKKPISRDEAYKYAREIETFRRQCHDERCLQVIEKLSSYMKFLIREQSTKDIEDVNVTHQTEPIEELHTENDNGTYTAGPQCNTIDTEVDQSALDLSIVETKDSLASSDINDKKIINQNSLSTITQENLNEAYVNKNDTRHHIMIESEIAKVNTINQNQTDIVDVTSIKPQNLLSNFEYDNYKSDQNYTQNKLTQHSFKESSNKTYNDMSTENNTSQSEINNQNDVKQKRQKIVDDSNQLSNSILDNFGQGKYTVLSPVKNNTSPNNNKLHHDHEIPTNTKDTVIKYNKINLEDSNLNKINITDTINKVINYNNNTNKRNIKLNPVIQKDVSGDNNKVSQNHLNNSNSVSVQNNKNTKKSQQLGDYERPDYIADTKNEFTIHSNISKGIISRGNNTRVIEIINPHTIKQKATGENSSKLSQNTNTQHPKHFVNPTPIIEKENTNNKDNAKGDISQQINVTNGVATVLKMKNTVKKEATKTPKKRTYHRKKKVSSVATAQRDLNEKEIVNSTVQTRIVSENSRNSSIKKNKRVYLKKKREVIDMTWVENVKFVRVIETEEYTKFENFEESFWSDLTVPPYINLTDFEYDNINIWKT